MKLYAVYFTYFKKSNISQTLNTNLLLFSEKYSIIEQTVEKQKNYIIQHIKDTYETDIYTVENTIPQNKSNLQSVQIQHNDLIYLITVNEIQAEPKTEEFKTEELKPGDLVTLKPEAIEQLKIYPSQYNTNTTISIYKIVSILGDKVDALVCAVKTDRPSDTTQMGARHSVPKAWLKKVYL